jgi:hypothetical protein
MLHIIQENLFKEVHYELLINTLKKFDIPYKIVRVYPFVDRVVDLNDIPEDFDNVEDLKEIEINEPVWIWGSLTLTKISREKGWNPGTLLNDNHDYLYYSKMWKEYLLNFDSIIATIGEDINWNTPVKFLRPTEDNKAFTGAIYDEETWNNTKKWYLDNKAYTKFNESTKIQISSVKNIQKEIRLWIVDDKVITGSYYRLGDRHYLNSNIEQEAIDFAYNVIERGSLARAWVLDICLSDNNWKVVEAGCINHAGFYASEIDKLVIAIEELYENKRS